MVKPDMSQVNVLLTQKNEHISEQIQMDSVMHCEATNY
jgi:hypothetical protein